MKRKFMSFFSNIQTLATLLLNLRRFRSLDARWLKKLRERRNYMTRNQIEYNKLLETTRANQAQERLTDLRDRAAREAKAVELRELGRHNLATENENARHNISLEALSADEIAEKIKHNRATEDVQRFANIETRRANLAREQQQRETLAESKRHSTVLEDQGYVTLDLRKAELSESKRHSMAQESIGRTQAAAQLQQAAAAGLNARAASSRALTAAHEANTRSRQVSADIAATQERLRQSQHQLGQKDVELSLRSDELAQKIRRDAADIDLGYAKLDETSQHNRASELIEGIDVVGKTAERASRIIKLWGF